MRPMRSACGGCPPRSGRWRVTGASADVALGAPGTVRAARGDVVLDLGELYPWLASLDRLHPALKNVRGVTGTAVVRLASASGGLADLEALHFEATVEPDEVRADLAGLPAPLTLAGGKASATRRTVQLDRIGATLLDARVTASGRVEDYASPDDRRLDLTLTAGAAGARASTGYASAGASPRRRSRARRSRSPRAGCTGPPPSRASTRRKARSFSPATRTPRSISPGGRRPSTCGDSR